MPFITPNLYETKAYGSGRAYLAGGFRTDGAGAVSSVVGEGIGVTKPGAAGLYRIAIPFVYDQILSMNFTPFSASPQTLSVQAQAETEATAIIDLQCVEGNDDCVYVFRKGTADANAGDATTEFAFLRASRAMIVTSSHFLGGAITGHADNYADMTISKRDGAGGAAVTVGTYSTDTDVAGQGTVTNLVPKAFTNGTLANRTLAAGNILTFAIAKAGSGVVVPISAVQITYTDLIAADLISGGVDFMIVVEDR